MRAGRAARFGRRAPEEHNLTLRYGIGVTDVP